MEIKVGRKRRIFDMTDRDSTGRFLAIILRHNPSAAGITLDAHGWADAD